MDGRDNRGDKTQQEDKRTPEANISVGGVSGGPAGRKSRLQFGKCVCAAFSGSFQLMRGSECYDLLKTLLF